MIEEIIHKTINEHEVRITRLEKSLHNFLLTCPVCGALLERVEIYHNSPTAGLYKPTCEHCQNIRVSVG
jgi:C4-type Zn-finger protein